MLATLPIYWSVIKESNRCSSPVLSVTEHSLWVMFAVHSAHKKLPVMHFFQTTSTACQTPSISLKIFNPIPFTKYNSCSITCSISSKKGKTSCMPLFLGKQPDCCIVIRIFSWYWFLSSLQERKQLIPLQRVPCSEPEKLSPH